MANNPLRIPSHLIAATNANDRPNIPNAAANNAIVRALLSVTLILAPLSLVLPAIRSNIVITPITTNNIPNAAAIAPNPTLMLSQPILANALKPIANGHNIKDNINICVAPVVVELNALDGICENTHITPVIIPKAPNIDIKATPIPFQSRVANSFIAPPTMYNVRDNLTI